MFVPTPMLYNPSHDKAAREAQPARYAELAQRYDAEVAGRAEAASLIAEDRNDMAATTRLICSLRKSRS